MFLNKELNAQDARCLILIRANRAKKDYSQMYSELRQDAENVIKAMAATNSFLKYTNETFDPRSLGMFRLYIKENVTKIQFKGHTRIKKSPQTK